MPRFETPIEDSVSRYCRKGGCWLCLILALLPVTTVSGADNPNDVAEPAFAEYDVDPNWPKRPAELSSTGGVAGIAVDQDDNVWVLQRGADPIQIYRPDGTFVRSWGRDLFRAVHQIRFDPEGNVWIADFMGHVVEKFTTEGKLLLTLGTRDQAGDDATHFFRPTDMVVSPQGDIFVTDGYGNRRVVHFDKHGKFVKSWGKYGVKPGEFVLPHSIVIDSLGRLYVADRNIGRIQVFDQNGDPLDVWSGFVMPWSLQMTSRDELWVCGSSPHWWTREGVAPDVKDQVLIRLSTDGRIQQLWTLPLGQRKAQLKEGEVQTPGETFGVHAIALDSIGNIYVGDIYGERAQKLVSVTKRSANDQERIESGR